MAAVAASPSLARARAAGGLRGTRAIPSRRDVRQLGCGRTWGGGKIQGGRRRGSRDVGRCAGPDPGAPLDLDALLEEVDIGADARHWQEEAGATFDENGVAVTFGNDEQAMQALETGAALVDLSHHSRLRVAGRDARRFLHDQSTNAVAGLPPGSGCETCFVTPQGRLLDLATVYSQSNSFLVCLSPGMGPVIKERLDKYVFPADDVQVQDVTSKTGMIALVGPESVPILEELRVARDLITERAEHTHVLLNFQGSPVQLAKGAGMRGAGFTMVADEAVVGELWRQLVLRGSIPMGSVAWERARVLQGRPAVGTEITEDRTPLEAGLYHAVSLNKGCYVGQETLSKAHNLGAHKMRLWGLRLQYGATCSPGDPVTDDRGEQCGRVTSATDDEKGFKFALAFLKARSRGDAVDWADAKVAVNNASAFVERLAYPTWEFAEGAAPPTKQGGGGGGGGGSDGGDVEGEKERKLREMAARLEAFQKAQRGGSEGGEQGEGR